MSMLKTILFLIFLTASCAGYRLQDTDNPFKQYKINSIEIPMFYNQSTLSGATPLFTKEIYRMVSGFDNLKIKSSGADATLIGILMSKDKIIETIVPGAPRSVENIVDTAIAQNRGEFYIPSNSTVNLTLKIIVIKQPTEEEIKFLRSKSSNQEFISSKIIFSESIPLTSTFTRELYDNESSSVIHTQNRGSLRKSLIAMSKSAAETFREMILYAF
jgi:hypothetical protein